MHRAKTATDTNSMNANTVKSNWIWFILLVVLGMTLGVMAAYFISRGNWLIPLALIATIPILIAIVLKPFSGIVIWLLLMPFYLVLPNSSLIYWVIYRILPPVIFCLAVLLRILKRDEYLPARLGPPELAMGMMLLYVPVSTLLFQENRNTALTHFGDRLLIPFCFYMAIRLLAPQEKELIQLQWVTLFIALSQSFIGFLSWFAPQVLPQPWHYLQGYRTTGSLIDPDLYAVALIFSAVILIQGAVNRKSRLIRFIYFVASGLCAIFVFLSLERAAWLGGIFVIIGLLILYPKVMVRLIVIGSIVMAILGTGILSTHISLSVNRFTENSPIYDRIVIFDAMSQMFQQKPVLGWGYETLDQNIQHYYRSVGNASITNRLVTSHNTYLTVLTELGLVGFSLYMFPVLWWLVLSFRVWSRIPKEGLWSRKLLAGLWLVSLFNFIVSNFMDMRFFPFGLTLWWMILGLIANMVYPYLKNRGVIVPARIGFNGNYG